MPTNCSIAIRTERLQSVREHLLKDQGHLCAYCMCTIPREDVPERIAKIKIEHYIPRSPEDGRDVGQGLDYRNLYAVCNGNMGTAGTRSMRDLTCDTYRGNKEFRVLNPGDAETLAKIAYTLEGEMVSEDPDVSYDLNEVLNLNALRAPLIYERKAVLDEVISELEMVPAEQLQDYCRSLLHAFSEETDPKTPYQGIIIWYLNSFI